MTEQEIWKSIPGYEGKYEISNLGRVKSLKRSVEHNCSYSGLITICERILKAGTNRHGYYSVFCYKEKISKSYKIHRLVGQSFIPNPDNLPEVNHKDGNKANNNVTNLEWVSRNENIQHAINIGLIPKRGKSYPARKVINTITKKIFECGMDAHEHYGKYSYVYFGMMLTGYRKNKTNYEYCN